VTAPLAIDLAPWRRRCSRRPPRFAFFSCADPVAGARRRLFWLALRLGAWRLAAKR
jgi:hypothetical protein